MAGPRASEVGRERWRKVRAQGMRRFLLVGALRRGIPMAIITLALIEAFEPNGLTRDRLASPEFAKNVLFVFTVFLAGGALSAFGRWKGYESLYGGDEEAST
jgi:hypothetical protein